MAHGLWYCRKQTSSLDFTLIMTNLFQQGDFVAFKVTLKQKIHLFFLKGMLYYPNQGVVMGWADHVDAYEVMTIYGTWFAIEDKLDLIYRNKIPVLQPT